MTIDITVKTDPEFSWRNASNGGGKLKGLTARAGDRQLPLQGGSGPCTIVGFIGMRGKRVKGGFVVNTRAFAKLCHKFLAAYVAGGGTFDDLHHDHEEKECVWCEDEKEKGREP